MVDFDQNGTIKYDEFLTATVDVGMFMTSNNINSVFKIFDFDDDGYITPENIVQSFTNIGEVIQIDEARAMVRHHDSNFDQQIGLDEFTQMMTFNDKALHTIDSEEKVLD